MREKAAELVAGEGFLTPSKKTEEAMKMPPTCNEAGQCSHRPEGSKRISDILSNDGVKKLIEENAVDEGKELHVTGLQV